MLEKLQQALSLSREADDKEGEATWLMAISLVYEHLSDYEQALAHSKQARAAPDFVRRAGQSVHAPSQ